MNAHTPVAVTHTRGPIEGAGVERLNIVASASAPMPNSWADIDAWIERHPLPDRGMLVAACLAAWNLAARIDAHNEATERQRCTPNANVLPTVGERI